MYTLCRVILILSAPLLCYSIAAVTVYFGALAILGLTVGWFLMKKRGLPSLSACGTARWAEEDELRRSGMLADRPGLIIGRLNGVSKQPISVGVKAVFDRRIDSASACRTFLGSFNARWSGPPPLVKLCNSVHTAVFAPTGAGKGVSCVIPFLLDCRDSCVVTDFKGELALATAQYRQQVLGHRIVILDPFKMVTQTPDTFNPLNFIDKNSPTAIDDCCELAQSQVIRTGHEHDLHWLDAAEMWISAMIAAVVQYGDPDDRSLQTVRDLLVDPANGAMVIKLLSESKEWSDKLQRFGNQLKHFRGDELGSTMTTANRFLRHLDTMAIDESTRTSSFDPNDLTRQKMTVYLVLPPERARVQSPLLRMWIGSMLRAVVRNGLQEQSKVHFVLDEASSLGHLDQLDDALDKYRGYGVRLTFIYQSLGQLKKCFPDGQDETFLSNVNSVFFAVNDWETADYVSKRLGEETIVVASGGTSSGDSNQYSNQGHSSSRSHNSNDNWQQQSRRLLKPEEVMTLSPRTAITFMQGMRPICTTLARYFEDDRAATKSFLRPAFTLVVSLCFLVCSGLLALTVTAIGSPQHQSAPQPAQNSIPPILLKGR